MRTVLVVGSGPSGVHFAQTLLDNGHAVVMLDVGNEKPAPVLPGVDFDGLKEGLGDPVSYFLGARSEGVVFPAEQSKYFALPPSKDYVFEAPREFAAVSSGFEPLISFATGGLAEAWTAGVYPLNDAELAEFPFDFRASEPYYAAVVRRIGITAQRDDLERFSPWFPDYMDPVEADPHSARLLERYARRRTLLNRDLGFYLGRSRVAVLSRDHAGRSACDKLGRCLWGCPRHALYSASSTLQDLLRYPNFHYARGMYVTHFTYEGDIVSAVVANDRDGTGRRFTADSYALAAGVLCSSKILLDSIFRRTGQVHELSGLMDNRQIMMPFLSPSLLGRPVKTRSYQLHQVALGIERQRPEEYVHGQITTLKTASVHPVVQSLPLDLRSALSVFRMTHAALGAANLWLHDRRDVKNVVTIRPRERGGTDLVLRYSSNDETRVADAIRVAKRALGEFGCIVPPGMTKVLPSGSSVHYAGTVPMRRAPQSFACTPDCRSYDFRNLYFADGATFPFLPAKNLTFTLMANAIRVAESVSRALAA
jgi:choline dehydrogenase-like flavoprotein